MTNTNNDQNIKPAELNETFKVNRTGLIYDPVMLDYECDWDELYPEKPDRIKKPYERCQFYGLTEKCVRLPGRMCTDEEIEKCHTQRVNRMMRDTETMSKEQLMEVSEQYDSMYFSNGSSKAARFALGSSLDLMDSIMTGEVDNGFAIIRPPGHHAMCNDPNGYCYFNNAAICAKTAIEKYGLQRVLIVDWDVHHGQGVQYAFYDDPKVLYYSMHRYDYGEFWPNLRQGDFDYIGEKDGKGFNINVPLNKTGFGNSEYSAAFYNLLLPIAYEYKPELVIVSCGYDAAIGCFEGRMKVSPAGYAHFINALSCLSDSKLCVLLEGGYCIKSLSEGVALTVRALLGYPTPRVEDYLKPHPIFVKTIENLTAVLRPYWKCLQNLNDKDSVTLSEYLEAWEKNHRQNVKFYDTEHPPEKFELTGFYPLWDKPDEIRLDKEIDALIEKTDLFVPRYKTCVCFTEAETALFDIKGLSRGLALQEKGRVTNLSCVIESICARESLNGLSVLYSDKNDALNQLETEVISQKKKYDRIKKILVLNVSNEKFTEKLTSDESILCISLLSDASSNNRSRTNISLNLMDCDTLFLAGFLRAVLPISYQFNPDLVYVYAGSDVSASKTKISLKCFEHALRLSMGLANNNTIVVFESKTDSSDQMKLAVNKTYNILLGEPCESITNQIPDEKTQKQVKSIVETLKADWDCLQFNEKIPQ